MGYNNFFKNCLAVVLVCLILFLPQIGKIALAIPQGGKVVHGNVTINANAGNGIDMLITQLSQKGIIDWQSFSIGANEGVRFAQPGASAVTLNRVLGGDISKILGRLTATGQILILNPSGILFGPNARVDVAGLIASTGRISNEDFLRGRYFFVQGPNNTAKIVNQGYIKIADHGLVALVAPAVENSGIIEANLGKVVLGATPAKSTFTIDFYGDDLLHFSVPTETNNSTDTPITQSGKIIAPGGKVLLSANSAKNIVDRSINMSGVIEANSVYKRGGTVILRGGSNKGVVSVTGKISARGTRTGVRGGTVKISGEKTGLFAGSIIDVSGDAGGGLVLIGGDYQNDIIVPTATATYVDDEATILANALRSGDGGQIIVWSNDSTRFYGTAEAKGGPEGGSGGFVEVSTKKWLDIHGSKIDLSAPKGKAGTFLLDPYDVVISNADSSGGSFTLEGIWVPSGSSTPSFIKVFDLVYQLGLGSNVIIQTIGFSDPGAVGNITVLDPINYTGTTLDLTLQASNSITINPGAPISGDLNLNLIGGAGGNISIQSPITVTVLDVTGAPVTLAYEGAAVTTSGSQTYQTPVSLGNNTILTAGGNVIFNNTVDSLNAASPKNLTITTPANITFQGAIGASKSLANLNLTAGTTNMNGGGVTTTGTQTYNTPLQLGANSTFTASNLTFNNSINGPVNLTLNTGNTGDILLNGQVGTFQTPLSEFIITNARNVTTNDLIFTRAFTQSAGSGTTSFFWLFAGNGGTGTYVKGTGSGPANITTNNVIGNVDVGSLTLLTNFANLNGYLAGVAAPGNINLINLQNRDALLLTRALLGHGTHFWGGQDILGTEKENFQLKTLEESYQWLKNMYQEKFICTDYNLEDNADGLLLVGFTDCSQGSG